MISTQCITVHTIELERLGHLLDARDTLIEEGNRLPPNSPKELGFKIAVQIIQEVIDRKYEILKIPKDLVV